MNELKTPFEAKYTGLHNWFRGRKVIVVNTKDCTAHSPYVTVYLKGTKDTFLIDINDLKY